MLQVAIQPAIYVAVVGALGASSLLLSFVRIAGEPDPIGKGAFVVGTSLDCIIIALLSIRWFQSQELRDRWLDTLVNSTTRIAGIGGLIWITSTALAGIVEVGTSRALDAIVFGQPNLGIIGATFFLAVRPRLASYE